MEWKDKINVKKGDLAENIIRIYLEKLGYVVYHPITKGRHLIDIIAVDMNKLNVMAADVKAKARRTYFPDTGIDIYIYERYREFSDKHNMPIFLFFVDEYLNRIYGNWLSKLEQRIDITHNDNLLFYPKKEKGIICFPLVSMITIGELTEKEANELKKYSQRKYDYE